METNTLSGILMLNLIIFKGVVKLSGLISDTQVERIGW